LINSFLTGRCAEIATAADGRRLAWHTRIDGRILDSEGVEGRGLSSAKAAGRTRRFRPQRARRGLQWPICTAIALSIVVAAEIRKAVLAACRCERQPTSQHPRAWSHCP